MGAVNTASSPYYASNCASLLFHPTLIAATQAHTSRLTGTSLAIAVTSHPGEANVAKTDLQLPAQLPARLTTLQKACPAKTFEANPATCPAEATIGTATVTTPILESPLTGPIYLVSFGNEITDPSCLAFSDPGPAANGALRQPTRFHGSSDRQFSFGFGRLDVRTMVHNDLVAWVPSIRGLHNASGSHLRSITGALGERDLSSRLGA